MLLQSDEVVYAKQCAAQPGFSTSFNNPDADRTSFADYKRLCSKWQSTVTTGLRTALLSEDAVQIRNAFLILTTTLKVRPPFFFPEVTPNTLDLNPLCGLMLQGLCGLFISLREYEVLAKSLYLVGA